MTAKDILLFSTENGEIYEWTHFGRLVLTFKGYWAVFDREGFMRFHNQLVRLVLCTIGRSMLATTGLRLFGNSDSNSLRLTRSEAEELVWLMDSACYMLSTKTDNISNRIAQNRFS